MFKEFLWYIAPERFSNIAKEIEEAVQSYALSKNQSGKKRQDNLRIRAQLLCEHHLVHSGIRDEKNVCINIDTEFFSEGSINQTQLNNFIKEIVKAYCYQKVLWEYMGTTSSFSCISTLAMEQDGFVYEDYLPVSYKRDVAQKEAEKIKRENKVPLYAYADGTISEHYDKNKARFRFDTLKDTSGFNWHKSYDPNDTIEKKDWHGAFDKDGIWVKVNESEKTKEIGSITQPTVAQLKLIKEADGALLYDGSGFFSETSDILYIDALLHVYAHSQNDKTATVERIKEALKELQAHSITQVACPAAHKKETLERYRKALGNLASKDLVIIDTQEAQEKREKRNAQQAAMHTQRKAIQLEQSIHAGVQGGIGVQDLKLIDIEKGIPVALSRTDSEDLKTLLSKPAEIEYIQTLHVPDEQEELFNRLLIHLLYVRKQRASDITVQQLTESVYDYALRGKKSSAVMGYQTSFYTLCSAEDELEKRIRNTKTEYDISVLSERERFLQELVHKKHIAQENVHTIEQELSSLYESISEEQKDKTNRSIQNALYAYKDIATSTGMSIKEIIQKAAQQQNATDDMIIYREVPLQTLIKYASTQKPLSKTIALAPLDKKTSLPIIIGAKEGSSIEELLYNHSGKTLAPEIIAILQTIRLSPTASSIQKQQVKELIQQTLNKTKGQAHLFESALYSALDTTDGVAYNLADKAGLAAYEKSERFRKSGLSKTQLTSLIRKATQSGSAQEIHTPVYEKTIKPVYRVKEDSGTHKASVNGIPPQVYPVSKHVYEAHKQNGTLDTLMAFYTGTKDKAINKNSARSSTAIPFGQPAQTPFAAESFSATKASPVSAGADNIRQKLTSPSSTAPQELSAADKEKLRMARINANYEHDKKLLAKEDPAFVRSPFHNIGHAQGNEELSERDLYKIARELNEEQKEKLRNGR